MDKSYSGFFEENTSPNIGYTSEKKPMNNINFMENFNFFYNVKHKKNLGDGRDLVNS